MKRLSLFWHSSTKTMTHAHTANIRIVSHQYRLIEPPTAQVTGERVTRDLWFAVTVFEEEFKGRHRFAFSCRTNCFTMFGCITLSIKAFFLLITVHNTISHRTASAKSGKTREYYIAAVELDWDYAPSGMNNAKGLKLQDDSDASVFTTRGATTIGKVYKKVLYREYTDGTFTVAKPHPAHLGILGPVIKAEVGDVIKVYFKNKANNGHKYTVHPHGVFYTKSSEGALYEDKTTGEEKKDDHVSFNGEHTYEWHIPEEHGPTKGDERCLTWIYHSHVDPAKDINTGLIGPMLTCKKGTLDDQLKRTDVDKEFFVLFTVFDENVSWLLDKNIDSYCSNPTEAKKKKEDEDFKEANKMHSINGLFYANLPGLELCAGDKISWHLFGIGNEVDIHTAYFHGQTFEVDSRRKDVATLLPATFVTASMVANNPGTWMMNCVVDDHYDAGMYALFNVSQCDGKSAVSSSLTGKTRTYYIAAEETSWDYGPSGMNLFKGGQLNASGSDSEVFFTRGPHRIGGRYKKALYFEYTNASFTSKKKQPDHLGFLGPVIRAEVGDTIKVVFKNMATRNYSIQPHGVFFNKSNEGALYNDLTSGKAKLDDVVGPNQVYTYTWSVPEHTGPTKNDAQCLTWLYYSSLDPVRDTYSGLFGPLLTCKKGSLEENGAKQRGIDKEFVLLLMVTDESMSWYHEENKRLFCSDPSGIDNNDESYKESNKMHGINGLLYANLKGLSMCRRERVSWHLIGLGNEVDMHTVTFYGQTVMENQNRKDTVSLLPGSFTTAYMTPDNVGQWAVICKTTDHYLAGMQAKYDVEKCGTSDNPDVKGKTRKYYIAAVEREWDYAPSGKDVLKGTTLENSEKAATFTKQSSNRIGRKYKKALYREYEDESFNKEKRRTGSESYLGVLGPIIYAEVGDTIEVVFKNKATSRDFSVHPHGVFFSKGMEGSDYLDGSQNADQQDNRVSPGKTFTYRWSVPQRAGPGPTDTNCITWAYYSDVDSVKDANSGLVGPMVVCRKNTLTYENKRHDVDRDFALLFTVMDENQSWYIDKNIQDYCTASVNKEDEDFLESNKMHVINGYVFGNLQGLEMTKGEKVDWYLMGLGNEVDMHTVHFHGQTFVAKSLSYHRKDVYDLFPGVFATVEMIPDSTGHWMLHCHVNDHVDAGMETMFSVKEKTDPNTARMRKASFPVLVAIMMIPLIVTRLSW